MNENQKICVCLRGIFKKDTYKHPSGLIIDVDSSKCVDNIKRNLICKLDNPYIVCVASIDDDISEIIKCYKPNKLKIESSEFTNVYEKISTYNTYLMNLVLELEYEEKIKFDMIFVTRYDILFDDTINFLQKIDHTKYNTLCRAERNDLVDDIFCCFNSNFIYRYILANINLIDSKKFTHELSVYNNNIGEDNINFLFEGNYLLFKTRPLIKFYREICFI